MWGGDTDFTGSVAQGLNDDKRELKTNHRNALKMFTRRLGI